MDFRHFLTILRDLFMPQPRNTCPHCGGIRCIGACQFNERQPVAAVEGKEPQAAPLAEPDACPLPRGEAIGQTAQPVSAPEQK